MEKGKPHYDDRVLQGRGYDGRVPQGRGYDDRVPQGRGGLGNGEIYKTTTAIASTAAELLPWPFGLHVCSRMNITDSTHPHPSNPSFSHSC